MTLDRPAVIELYDRLIAPYPELTRKGKTSAYTAISGNMFSFVGPDGEMCLRLSKEDIAAYGASWNADPVVRYERVMNGYVAVSQALLNDLPAIEHWFARSVAFARTLKPKATKR